MPRPSSTPLSTKERDKLLANVKNRTIETRIGINSTLSAVAKWNLTVTDMLHDVLLEPSVEDKSITRFKKVTRALVEEAEAGSVEATKLIFERLEGRPAQTIHHDGKIEYTWSDLVRQAIEEPRTTHRILSDETEPLGD